MYVSVGLCKFKCNAICLDTIVKNEYKENYDHNNHDHNQSKKSGWFFWTMIQVEHSFHRLVYHAAPSTTAASSGSQALDGTPKSHSQLHDWQLRKQGWAYSVVAHLWKGTLKVFDATLLRPPPLWMAKAGPPNEIHREIQKKKHVDVSVLQKATKPPRNYASKALVHLQKCSVYGHEKVKYPPNASKALVQKWEEYKLDGALLKNLNGEDPQMPPGMWGSRISLRSGKFHGKSWGSYVRMRWTRVSR